MNSIIIILALNASPSPKSGKIYLLSFISSYKPKFGFVQLPVRCSVIFWWKCQTYIIGQRFKSAARRRWGGQIFEFIQRVDLQKQTILYGLFWSVCPNSKRSWERQSAGLSVLSVHRKWISLCYHQNPGIFHFQSHNAIFEFCGKLWRKSVDSCSQNNCMKK